MPVDKQEVLIDMSYNMGSAKLSSFKKMKSALQSGNYQQAAKEMEDSKWFKQVGRRSKQLKAIMGEPIPLKQEPTQSSIDLPKDFFSSQSEFQSFTQPSKLQPLLLQELRQLSM